MTTVIEDFVHPFIYEIPFSEEDAGSFPEHKNCPCCRSTGDPQPLVQLGAIDWKSRLTLVQCPDCELIYYKNPPSADMISEYYREQWNQSVGETLNKPVKPVSKSSPRMANLLADLGQTPEGKSILDVGCGNGKLMAGLVASGFSDVWGTEASSFRVALCSARFPGKIFSGGYEGIPDDSKFDVIYSNHVVEHFHNPADALHHLAGHLTDTGVVAITVPDSWEESVPFQVLFLPHLHSFCALSLKLMGEQYGFSCLFWRGARWEELTVIYYRDPAHIAPISDRFCTFEQLPTRSSGSQIRRIREPWVRSKSGKTVACLTLLRTESNAEQRRKGYDILSLPKRLGVTALNLFGLILRKARMDKLRLYLFGNRGFVRIRRRQNIDDIPVISTRGNGAAFFVK